MTTHTKQKVAIVVCGFAIGWFICTSAIRQGRLTREAKKLCAEGMHDYGRWEVAPERASSNQMPMQSRRCGYCHWVEWKVSEIKP